MSRIADLLLGKLHLRRAYKHTFEAPEGKQVLLHLMKSCHMLTPTFVAGDPHQTAMNEGSRRVVLSILKMLNTDEKELLKQIEEEKQNES